MEAFYGVMKFVIGLVVGNEIWKANDERNLGFTIFWTITGMILVIIFSLNT